MIVIVHFIGIIIFQILRNRKRLKVPRVDCEKERTLENQFKFDPPLFRQRYGTVSQILVREQWRTQLKKLVDFGCGEFGLFMYLKRLTIEELVFVDIDEYLLAENLFRIQPLPVDCLRRRHTPLTVSVYRGSVIDPDYRLRKTDVVTAVELIEHLYPDTLDAFPYNVFFFIKPKLVVITTPNADFNVAFKRSEAFRHPDHKFEWTSEQFKDWGTNLTKRFPDYTVEFLGIGEGPKQFEQLGCCSQAALFIRKDLLDDCYQPSDCVQCCQCAISSPCKGQTVESKLQCTCLCSLCLPDVSVGVCTYLSHNISEKAYRPMKMGVKKCQSDQKLDFWSGSVDSEVINKSHNIFYKLMHTVQYLYEIDKGLDKDRLVGTLKYRVRTFSTLNSRFYVEEREQCEIPLTELIYGDVEISVDEVGHLLLENDYRVEKCLIPENEQFELCVITIAQEMEEITSSSEVTECSTSPPLDGIQFELGETSSAAVEKKADPLVDSGYLKSPSPLEVARALPQEPSEVDLFEDLVPTPSMRSDDNKLHLKKPEVANNRPKVLDLNRVNELDRFRNVNAAKTFLKPLKSPKDFPVAGTSSAWKKHHRKTRKSPDKEPTPLDDVKSLTNCIVQNSLNRVDSDVDSPELINFPEDVVDAPRERVIPLPPPVVENGDLANNNRDNEGNNLPENEVEEQEDEGIDLLNDNLEDLPIDNVVAVENNNGREEVEPLNLPQLDVVEEQNDLDQLEQEDDSSIAKASREVLYDVDSVPDLLEDVDIPPQPDVNPLSDVVASANVVLVGIHPIATTASIQTNRNSFPDWLLQILGTQVATEPTTGHDEPHFYCQGDGLGVHPSVIAVEGDEADNESSTEETSSSNNTQDYADAEPGPSDMVDMSSLQEESLDSVTSNGAILVDEIIRAAQDQIESTSLQEETSKVGSTSQTSSNQSTEPERSNVSPSESEDNTSQLGDEEPNRSEIL